MSEILVKTFKSIEAERPYFNQTFFLLRQLIEEYGKEDIFERLYDDISLAREWETIAELFRLLEMNMGDDGAEARRCAALWLEAGDDPRKIAIALSFNSMPIEDETRARNLLSSLARRHPGVVAQLCEQTLARKS